MFSSQCRVAMLRKGTNRTIVTLKISDGLVGDSWTEDAFSSGGSMDGGTAVFGGTLRDTTLSCEGKTIYSLDNFPRSNAWRTGLAGKARYFGNDPQLKAVAADLVWKIEDAHHV